MTKRRTPKQQYDEAITIATEHGLIVQDKAGVFHVYRKMPTRPAYIGHSRSAQGLRQMVCKAAKFN